MMNQVGQRKQLEILLVEDNRSDVELVQEGLASWDCPIHLTVLEDGEQAIQFLLRTGSYSAAPTPDLVLLDLNLPRKDGTQVLTEIRANQSTAAIPVIVLTTSDREQDVRNAYALHANGYVTKPLEINTFFEKMSAIEKFWVNCARLPQRRAV